jgi:hypothetical protein
LENPSQGKTAVPTQDWATRLLEARKNGHNNHKNQNLFTTKAGADIIGELQQRRRANKPIDYTVLEDAVSKLEKELAVNDADDPGPDGKFALETTRASLKNLIGYASDQAYSEEIRLTNKLRFNFGSQPPAPTRMGNIANTVQSYAEQRYKLNFEIFWSRMQRAIQKDKDFMPVLQQTKMQLDFLIACSALTAIWSMLWMVITSLVSAGYLPFLLAAVPGPLVAYVWYRVAVAHYQTFADVLRTCLDLFRFDLLKDLHIGLPGDLPEEQALWEMLHRIHSYYEPQSLHYEHKMG